LVYFAAPVIDAINWCREQLSRESFDYLRSFKPIAELPLGLGSMLLYHGSPRSHVEDILATTAPEILDTIFEERQATLMAGGDTHLQMLRQHRGRLVLNVGSVGMPFKEYVAGARPTIFASSLDVTEGRDADIATARAGGVLSATMSMAQMLLRPPNGRYRNVVIQPLAVGTAVPSRIWGGTLCDRP
jgi:hypothetical protein